MRPETGTMKFGEDWTGVFIRGDCCMGYQLALQEVIDTYDKEVSTWLSVQQLRGLKDLLCSSAEGADPNVQLVKDWKDVVKVKHATVTLPTLNLSSEQ